MAAHSFDPSHAVHFDLSHGAVRAGAEKDPVLLVPCSALEELVSSAPRGAVEVLGRALGAAIGRRAAARLAGAGDVSVEDFVAQLAGECAVAGVGVLAVERWGRALVVVIEQSRLAGALLAPMVGAALEAASGRRTSTGLLSRDERTARVLVSSEQAVKRVLDWIASGVPWGEALAKLQGGPS